MVLSTQFNHFIHSTYNVHSILLMAFLLFDADIPTFKFIILSIFDVRLLILILFDIELAREMEMKKRQRQREGAHRRETQII